MRRRTAELDVIGPDDIRTSGPLKGTHMGLLV
jgi:hypothetical protein